MRSRHDFAKYNTPKYFYVFTEYTIYLYFLPHPREPKTQKSDSWQRRHPFARKKGAHGTTSLLCAYLALPKQHVDTYGAAKFSHIHKYMHTPLFYAFGLTKPYQIALKAARGKIKTKPILIFSTTSKRHYRALTTIDMSGLYDGYMDGMPPMVMAMFPWANPCGCTPGS